MQIDNCGKHSKKLQEIYLGIMSFKQKNGEKMSSVEISNLDIELYNAYQVILSLSKDNNGIIIEDALNTLEKMTQVGNIEFSNISNLAGEIASKISYNNKTTELPTLNADVYNNSSFKINDSKDNAIINTICTSEMEKLHNDTFNKAKEGNASSVVVLDLINRASSYMINSDNLNPKGKELGALILVSRLLATNSPEAKIMAENLTKHFQLSYSMIDGKVDNEKINKRINELNPNLKMDDVIKRCEESAIKKREDIIQRSGPSFKEKIEDVSERKRIGEFLKLYRCAMQTGNRELLSKIVSENLELSKKACIMQHNIYKNFIENKKPENEDFRQVRLSLLESVRENTKANGNPIFNTHQNEAGISRMER